MIRKFCKNFDKISNKLRIFFLKKIFKTFPYHFAKIVHINNLV